MTAVMPVAGSDYPETFQQFDAWFRTERMCIDYLFKVRWPDGFVCPKCGVKSDPWPTARGLLMCSSCGHQATVRAGTIFHRSRMPLKVWYAAMWFVCAQKTGVSALTLQNQFGFGSYETAWAWMHKLRRAMVLPGRDLLGGPGVTVEVDQTFIGGRKRGGKSGPRYTNKSEVAVAVERAPGGRGFGRVRLTRIETANRGEELHEFIRTNIAHGSHLVTDGEGTYAVIAKKLQYQHTPYNLSAAGASPAHVMLPAVHQVAALLKRWLAGTIHNGHAPGHLQYYLDEYTFRFNRRHSKSRGLLWYQLLEQAVVTDPQPLPTMRIPHPVGKMV